MNRASRREHGHLLERVCPRCRTRLRLITRYIPPIQYPVRFESPLPNWQAICDDCGRMREMSSASVKLAMRGQALVTEAHFERDAAGEMRVYIDGESEMPRNYCYTISVPAPGKERWFTDIEGTIELEGG